MKSAPYYVLSFDGSLKKITQTSEMDLIFRCSKTLIERKFRFDDFFFAKLEVDENG